MRIDDVGRVAWSDARTGLCGVPEPGPGPWPLSGQVQRYRARLHLPNHEVTVAGAAPTREAALAACLGEAVERYAALLPREPDIVASAAELSSDGSPYVDPARLGADPAPDRDLRLPWLRASDGRLVPLAAAQGDLTGAAGATERYPHGSTGLAAGVNFDTAAESAAAEVIERDAVARAWTGERRAVRVERVLPEGLRRATRDAGLDLVVQVLPTRCASAAVVLVGLRDHRGLLGVGAAYRDDLTSAATKAWSEATVSLAQAGELVDATVGPVLCETAGLAPWRADRRYADDGWDAADDLSRTAQLLLDPALAGRVWRRLVSPPPADSPMHPSRPARELIGSLFDDVVEVDLAAPDVATVGGPVVVRVLAVGATTVRPASLTPQELPCPLV